MKAKKSAAKTLVLLDTHAILHRAYHALPDFASSKGEPTGALYGLSLMLISIANELRPDYIVAAYDLPGATYRHEAYKAYKAGRKKTDPALSAQIDKSQELIKAFNIPIYSAPGFEADDILGTIVEQVIAGGKQGKSKVVTEGAQGGKASRAKLSEADEAEKQARGQRDPTPVGEGRLFRTALADVNIVIASGDMDTMQLIDGDRVRVYTLKKGIKDTIVYDEKGILERYGFGPRMIPDYKGLRGDASDNIIGIAGIGEKTATDLIKGFGSIEDIYEVLGKGKKGEEKLLAAGVKPRIVELLKGGKEEAEFSKMLATIRRDAPIDFVLPEKPWREGFDMEKLEKAFKELEFRTLGARVKAVIEGKPVAGGKSPASPAGKQAASGDAALDAGPSPAEYDEEEKPRKGRKKKAAVDEDGNPAPETPAMFGELPPGVTPEEFRPIGIGAWLLDSNLTSTTYEDVMALMSTADWGEAKKAVLEEVRRRGLSRVYDEVELPLIPVLDAMKARGVKIDRAYLGRLSKEYHEKAVELEKGIYELAGQEFNVSSPKQLGEVLYDKLGLTSGRIKKTASGARSTKESELLKLADNPIVKKILDYRQMAKLLGTYIDAIPPLLDAGDRLHATFDAAGTTTGRMSSNNPNLQNIPIQTEEGRRIRDAFVAEDGFSLVSFDYSQIELRIAAFLSGDEQFMDIFRSGRDVHREVAARVFKVAPEAVTGDMRRKAKVINFGVMYGMGVNALRQNLGGTRAEAQEFYNQYFATFHGLARYLDQVRADAKRKGYTETLFGRRRYFGDIASPIPFIRAAAERMAINAPIQGTEADIVKLAMVRIFAYIKEHRLEDSVYILLQVHDELVLEVRDGVLAKVVPDVRKIMEGVVPLGETKGVPIAVEAHVGKNWGEK